MPRQYQNFNKTQNIPELLDIAENSFKQRNYRKAEAFLWKVKNIDPDYDIDGKLREIRYQRNLCRYSNKRVFTQSNNTAEVVPPINPTPGQSNFNEPKKTANVKLNNGKEVSKDDNQKYQKNTHKVVNNNEKKFDNVNNELKLLTEVTNEYISKGNLDEAQLTLDKADELYIPADIKALKDQIREAKLKIQKENDKCLRQKLNSLKDEEKKAFDCIEKAKEAILNRDIVSTDKYLIDAIYCLTEQNENSKDNTEKNKQYKDEKRKVSNVLENAIQTEALNIIKKAEQAFFTYDFEEAEKLFIISERLSPDEYVAEMIALIENAKQENISHERINNLSKEFFKQHNNEDNYEFNDLDFANTFKITNGFDKAQEMLKTMENLYPGKKAQEFLRRIKRATVEQIPSNYSYCDNGTIKESNKEEAQNCLTRAKEAYHERNYEKAERLVKISERMYPTDEAKALLNDIARHSNEEATRKCLDLLIMAIEKYDFNEADRLIGECTQVYNDPLLDYALNEILKICIKRMHDAERYFFERNSPLHVVISALSRGQVELAVTYLRNISPRGQHDRLVEHIQSTIQIMRVTEQNQQYKLISQQAEKYLKQGENAISEGNFENAIIYLTMSINLQPSERIDKMLIRLNLVTKCRKDSPQDSFFQKIFGGKDDVLQHKKIIQTAEIYFVAGDFRKALSCLSHSKILNTKRATDLKRLVIDQQNNK